jgi:hypothetical protein
VTATVRRSPAVRAAATTLLGLAALCLLLHGSAVTAAPVEAGAARIALTGDTAARIALTGDTGGALAERLRTELAARGLEVLAAPSFEPAEPFAPGVSAVLRIDQARRRVEIWTPDLEGGGARFRTALLARGDDDDRTLPVRIAEDVRAFVAPATTRAPPRAAPNTARPAPAALAPAPASAPAAPQPALGLVLGVDGTLLAPASGAGAGGAAFLRARHPLSARLAAGARLILPVVPATVTRGGQSASVAASLAAIEIYCRLLGAPSDPPWEAGLGAGLGLAWLRLSGLADSPFFGRRDDVWTALAFGAVEASRRLGPHVRLRASLLVGRAIPPVTIRFANVPISRWADPFTALALGADFVL